jgi:hypothetical protein
MTKRIYVCNVCRSEFHKGTEHEIVGFEWHTTATGEAMRPKLNFQCENHICLSCLKNLEMLRPLVTKA